MLPKPLPSLTSREVTRFWSNVDKQGACWVWEGKTNNQGYGVFRVGHSDEFLAHRIGYKLQFGVDPGKDFVRHRCDTPPCVRGTHLQLGNQADNMRDCSERGRLNPPYGPRNAKSKLTTTQVLAARALYRSGRSASSIARQFNVDNKAMWNVVNYRTYTWLDDNGINTRTGEPAI